jgi:hypothetical protein
MAHDDDLDLIPARGAHLAHAELVAIMRTLRALVAGTVDHEPNRAHAVSIAYIVTTAMDRAKGEG